MYSKNVVILQHNRNKTQVVEIMKKVVAETDLNMKKRDFEHLLFEPSKAEVIEHVLEIIM